MKDSCEGRSNLWGNMEMEIAIKQNENGHRKGEKTEYQSDEEILDQSVFRLHGGYLLTSLLRPWGNGPYFRIMGRL